MADNNNNNSPEIKDMKKRAEQIAKTNGTISSLFDLFRSTPVIDGAKRQDELNDLSDEVDTLLKRETNRFVTGTHNGKDIAAFMNSIFTKRPKSYANSMNSFMQGQSVEELLGDENSQINIILSERYKNVNNMYEDLRLLTEQVSELDEVILTMRDAITNTDNITSESSRIIRFEGESDEDSNESKMQTVETMEEVTGILDKLKKIVIPGTLTYGNFFVFTQPYTDLFAKFKALDDKFNDQRLPNMFEHTIALENTLPNDAPKGTMTPAMESICPLLEKYEEDFKMVDAKYNQNDMANTINTIMEGISVINDPSVPLLEDSSIAALSDEGIRNELFKAMKSKKKDKTWNTVADATTDKGKSVNPFSDATVDAKTVNDMTDEYKKEFQDTVKGVYLKLYDPRRVIPIRIMDYIIGYYVLYETVDETRSNVLNAVHTLSRTTMLFQNSKRREFEEELVSLLSARICENIDKKFLRKNADFKELIANAISYENFYTKSFKVQFVPVNYMTHFKVNEDYNTHMGVSVLKKSLFYGMLYLSILLFKIIMIVTRSSDTRMFMVKGSGVDKDISNRINRVIADYKMNQISYNDFGSVRGILSKVGKGRDVAIPVGANGERSFEIEVMQGQDIPLDTPLLELLRKGMISNTGCPSAMINYLEEVDFAKQIQMLNSKFVSRMVSMQSELEIPCTELYRKLISFGGYDIDEVDIDNIYFEWARPKALNSQNIVDIIGVSDSIAEFIIKMYSGDNDQDDPRIKDRIYQYVVKNITMNGVLDFENIEDDIKRIKLDFRQELKEKELTKLSPDEGGDSSY